MDDHSEDRGEDSGRDDRQGRREDSGVGDSEARKDKGVDEAGRALVQPQSLLVTDSFVSVSLESVVCSSLSSSSHTLCAFSVSLSGMGSNSASTVLPTYSCAVLPYSVGVSSALSSVPVESFSSLLSPISLSLFPPVPHCHVNLAQAPQSPLFPTPLGSPGDLKSPAVSMEKEVSLSGTELQSPAPSLSTATRPIRPLQIPRLVLPESRPSVSALSPMGPYSPISPASIRSPQLFPPTSPAGAQLLGPYSPISPASRLSQDPYSPITPVSLPPLGPYSPISPVTIPSLGPYSPISPATDAVPAGFASGITPSVSTSVTSWPMFASSQFLPGSSHPISSPWTLERASCSSWEGNAPLLSVAGNCGSESNNEQLAPDAGTSKLLVVVQWLCFWCGVSVVVRHCQPPAHCAHSI